MGSASDPRRIADARDRGRPVNRGEVHDQEAGTPISGVEDFLRNHGAGIASIDLFVFVQSLLSCSMAWSFFVTPGGDW